jgi:serine/threonine protein kinase
MIDPTTAVDDPIDSTMPMDDPMSASTLLEVMMKNSVLLDDRFEILEILGNGANGQVVKCSDGSGQLVAVKAIKLENLTEYRWRQTEIAILKEIRYSVRFLR